MKENKESKVTLLDINQETPNRIKQLLTEDVTNYYLLSYKNRGNLEYIHTVALEYKRKYEQELFIKHEYEERYFFKKIPKQLKILLNIQHYKIITHISHLYKEILNSISIIENYKELNKLLPIKQNINKREKI